MDNTETDTTEQLSYGNLLDMLRDIQLAPNWRQLADRCADYFDGNQLSADALADLAAKGMPDFVINLIAPVILTVLGMEEKTRTDWRVNVEEGEDQATDDLAEALSTKLHEVEKAAHADTACSEAYGAQVIPGLGWVEVSRETNPFAPSRYRVEYIHRSEIDFDWRDRTMTLDKARFLVRRKWFDNDVLVAMFPEFADKIKGVTGGWNAWDNMLPGLQGDTGLSQGNGQMFERSYTLDEAEWRDMGRKRTCLFEVWYRVYVTVQVIMIEDRAVEYDGANPAHVETVQSGLVKLTSAVVDRVRQSFWVGPYQLTDRPTPYKHNRFPYVPFFGFREDLSGAPYGMVRRLIGSQDEFNARRAKMYWLLSTRQVIADADVVLDHKATAQEAAQANSYIILNPNRKSGSELKIVENRELATDQFKVMVDAGENITKVAGIQQTLMNNNATSGLAKQVDIEQGVVSLARLNGNYRNARIAVGEMLLTLLKEDIGNKLTKVPIGEGPARKTITLNEPAGQIGQYQTYNNDVQRAMAKCDLDSVPASATYRQQLAGQLIEMTKALPPQIQGLVLDFVIEASDLPKRHEIADRIRKALNIGGDGEDQGQQQFQQQLQQIQDQAKQVVDQLQQDLAKTTDDLNAQKSQNLAAKQRIAELQVTDKQLTVDDHQAERQQGGGPDMVNTKLEMLAEQVGKLSRAVGA